MLEFLVNTVTINNENPSIAIDGSLRNNTSNDILLEGNNAAFYLKFINIDLVNYINTYNDVSPLSEYYRMGGKLIDEKEHSIIIDHVSYAIDNTHNTSLPLGRRTLQEVRNNTNKEHNDGNNIIFDETVCVPKLNMLVLVLDKNLNLNLKANSTVNYTINLKLKKLPNTNVLLDYTYSNALYPYGTKAMNNGFKLSNQNTNTNFKVLQNNVVLLFNFGLHSFLPNTNVKTKYGYKRLNMLNQNDEIMCENKQLYKVVKLYYFDINDTRELVTFKKDCFGNNMPYADTKLTSAHLVKVGDVVKPANQWVNDTTITKSNEYVNKLYHIHVKNSGTHQYAECNNLLADVWCDDNKFVKLL